MGKFKDLTGMKFNKLTVVKRVQNPKNNNDRHAHWLCDCDCGNNTIVASTLLTSGKIKSCGCLREESNVIDLTGQRFGRLTVISKTKRPQNCKDRYCWWFCQCD